MDLQRMKFAWARGAYFQHQHVEDREWRDLPRSTTPEYEESDRIHPDCVHLEYGHVSQGLIDKVLYGLDCINHPECDLGDSGFVWLAYQWDGTPNLLDMSHVELGMYQLFAAELLADEGL